MNKFIRISIVLAFLSMTAFVTQSYAQDAKQLFQKGLMVENGERESA